MGTLNPIKKRTQKKKPINQSTATEAGKLIKTSWKF